MSRAGLGREGIKSLVDGRAAGQEWETRQSKLVVVVVVGGVLCLLFRP